MDNQAVERIRLIKVPVDVVRPDRLEEVLLTMAVNGRTNQIVLLDYAGLMKARHNAEWRRCLEEASLVLPVSHRIRRGARFARLTEPDVYNPFPFLIRMLGILGRHRKSVYILGSSKKNIQIAEGNLKTSFPGLHFVGRYAGEYPREMEKNILMAIRKASPTLLVAGNGLKGRSLWLYRNREALSPGMTFWGRDVFEIISGRSRKPEEDKAGRFLRAVLGTLFRPWRFLLVFRELWWFLLLLTARIRRRGAVR